MRRAVNAARKEEVIRSQARLFDPLLHGVAGRLRDFELLNCTGRCVLCCITTARDATCSPWHTSRTLRLTRSQPRSLLSIPRLNSASSRTRLSICSRTLSAQMSLTLKGAFWPTILPLFHGSRCTALTLGSMMVSHQVEGAQQCADRATLPVGSWCGIGLLSGEERT